MTTKTIGRLIAALAFVFGSVGLMDSAQASFTIRVDCHGNNGQPTWAGSGDSITTQAKINGIWTTIAQGSMNNCTFEDPYWLFSPAFTQSDVTNIRVLTNGSDTFWIDELSLLDANNAKVVGWGVDNNVGYCVSEDPGDGNSAFCLNAVAGDPYTFNR